MAELPKADTLPIADTQAGREMNPNKGIMVDGNRFMVSENAVYEDKPSGYDFTYMTNKEIREKLGGNPDTEELCWIRNPHRDIWGSISNGEGKNRVNDFLREAGGRRVPMPNGEFFANQDLVAAFKSRAEVEAIARHTEEDAKLFQKMLDGEEDIRGDRHIPRYRTGQLTARDVEAEHNRNMASGIIGATAGRDWMEVVEKNPQKYKEDRARFLGGNITVADLDEADRERVDAAKSGKSRSSYAVGAKFAPEVTDKSALGQIRARK